MSFKEGNRVRVVGKNLAFKNPNEIRYFDGKVGFVDKVTSTNQWPYMVDILSWPSSFPYTFWAENELELVDD